METKSFSGKLSESKVVIRLIAGATLLGLINLYGHPGILAYGGLIAGSYLILSGMVAFCPLTWLAGRWRGPSGGKRGGRPSGMGLSH